MFLILTFLCEQCSITIIAFSGKSEYEMIPEKIVLSILCHGKGGIKSISIKDTCTLLVVVQYTFQPI